MTVLLHSQVFVHWEDPDYIGTPEGTQLTKPSALDPVVDIINERNLTVLYAVSAAPRARAKLPDASPPSALSAWLFLHQRQNTRWG